MSADCKANALFRERSMKGFRAASVTLVLILAAATGAVEAQASVCTRVVSASAMAPNGANLDPPQNYDAMAGAQPRHQGLAEDGGRTLQWLLDVLADSPRQEGGSRGLRRRRELPGLGSA